MQQRADTLDDAQIRKLLELRAKRAHLRQISSRAKVEEECDGGARSMELLLQQQTSTGVLESNWPPLMPALPLLLSPHILPWHMLFLALSNCALRGRISTRSVTVPRWRSRSLRLLLRQQKYKGVWSQTGHYLCLQCRCCSHVTSFFSVFFSWHRHTFPFVPDSYTRCDVR